MRLAFFGSPDFALPSFQKILADKNFTLELAATQPDRPAGRGLNLQPTALKKAALAAGLPVWEDIPSVADLQKAKIEKIAVVAYGRMIPDAIVKHYECINLHPSLLPQYRGPSPLQSALLNGDTETAVTTMLINEKMDAGDILLQENIAIEQNLDLAKLQSICAERGADLLIQTLCSDIQKLRKPQAEAQATYCRKINKTDLQIMPGESPWQIHNKVRAIGACLTHKGKRVKILATKYISDRLEIITVQPEGKAPMNYSDFVNGYGAIIL